MKNIKVRFDDDFYKSFQPKRKIMNESYDDGFHKNSKTIKNMNESVKSTHKDDESDDWYDSMETGGEPTYCPDCGVKFTRGENGDSVCPKCHKTPNQIAMEKRRKNESIKGKDDLETFFKMAKQIGIKTFGELDTFLKNEKQPGDKDEWETMLRYRASLGNDFKIDPKKVDGGSSKITESVSAVKNILNGLVSKDGKSIRAFRDDEKLPRGFRFKSGTGDHGEVSYKGTDYAYALVDGKLRVMPSSDAGWNWSETIYNDNYKEGLYKECGYKDPEYDYEGELMDVDDDHGTESPYELGEEDFDDDFYGTYKESKKSSIKYDDDFKVEEKCNKGGKLTESLHIKDGKYVNSNDDEEIGFYGYMLKNTMTGTDFLIYSTDKDDLKKGVKETIDYLVKGIGSEKELMDKNVYISCDEDTYGFDTFDVDEDGKVTVFGDAIALVGSDSIRF